MKQSTKAANSSYLLTRKYPIAKSVGGAFGNEFKNNIRPILKRYGVRMGNPGKKPVRYEMPDRSKGE